MKFGINNPAFLQMAGAKSQKPLSVFWIEAVDRFNLTGDLMPGQQFVSDAQLSFRVGDGDWEDYIGIRYIPIQPGQRVYFRNVRKVSFSRDTYDNIIYTNGAKYNIGGDLFSVMYPDRQELFSNAFVELFKGQPIVSAAELDIKQAEIPAEATSCYAGMFSECEFLLSAPKLPATILTEGCYSGMFSDCTNLSTITCLAEDISASQCLDNWVLNVGENGTFIKSANMAEWPEGDGGIPTGWTVQDYIG